MSVKFFPDIEQGTDEWLQLRKGKPTASRFSDIITAAKGDLSKSCEGYIDELIGECFCPEFEYFRGNVFTERGKEVEGEAREAFEAETGLAVRQMGFALAANGVCGCSPDGLIYDAAGACIAGVEIKCPSPKVHIAYVRGGVLPDTYKQQVHGSMAVTGLNEWHFWSYFPGMRHLHVVVKRDDYTAKVEAALAQFVEKYRAEMAQMMPRLRVDLRPAAAS